MHLVGQHSSMCVSRHIQKVVGYMFVVLFRHQSLVWQILMGSEKKLSLGQVLKLRAIAMLVRRLCPKYSEMANLIYDLFSPAHVKSRDRSLAPLE